MNKWSIYGVLRDKIVSAGVLPREVAYVHDAASDEERAELFRRANAGEVRVLIGATSSGWTNISPGSK